MRRHLALPLLLSLPLAAQAPPQLSAASPQLSPQAAYDQANAPIDITHRSIANWSDVEKAALDAAVEQAKTGCLERAEIAFTGDDLIAYARLCDLGQQWPNVYRAATTYINSHDPAKPQLDQAYAFEVIADLNMKQWKVANSTCFAMLRSVPYGPLTDGVTTTTFHYLKFAFLADALDLLFQRQPYILDLLRSSQPASHTALPPAPSIPLHTLFEHALDLAALQQYNSQPERAAEVLADIDRALPSTLPPDEALFIAADRRQYALLGTHFPDLPDAIPLQSPTASHHVAQGSVTVFLLFPPWCAQCIRQQHEMAAALLRHADSGAHMYGLLADNPPPSVSPIKPLPRPTPQSAHRATQQSIIATATSDPANQAADKPLPPKSAADQLRGTPTLIVSPSILADFNATDFPFLIATDHDGIIRLISPAVAENFLVKDGPVDQVIENIVAYWPPPPVKP
jgi:hypothetical protein